MTRAPVSQQVQNCQAESFGVTSPHTPKLSGARLVSPSFSRCDALTVLASPSFCVYRGVLHLLVRLPTCVHPPCPPTSRFCLLACLDLNSCDCSLPFPLVTLASAAAPATVGHYHAVIYVFRGCCGHSCLNSARFEPRCVKIVSHVSHFSLAARLPCKFLFCRVFYHP